MSQPNFPQTDPSLTRENVVNQILSSIAMEELGLSHVINAEGEKLQYALGTIPDASKLEKPLTFDEILELNKSIHKTLESTMLNQMFLKGKLESALSASIMQGPAGPVGTILDSYKTLDDLIADHPTGKQGDAYLVGGVLYVWDVENKEWKDVGDLTGPQGEQGTGTTIKGNYESKEEFEKNPPPGSLDDAYLVEGEIYIWNEKDGWHSGGSLKGSNGDKGDKGDKGDQGPPLAKGDQLFEISDSNGTEVPMDYDGNVSIVSETLDITIEAGPKIKIENPQPASYTIIPFASTIAPNTYSFNGNPSRVSLIGYGYGDGRGTIPAANYSIPIDSVTYSFELIKAKGNENKQLIFSLPFNMELKSIYITVGTYDNWNFTNSIYPYIQLFSAAPGSNIFSPIPEAYAMPEIAIGPGDTVADTMRSASKEKINYLLEAGTRIAVGAMMRTTGMGTETYWLYFTGGIGLAYKPNPIP